jgi:uncharacterized protein YhjY with autotransporter beta-barrel domain
MNQPSHFRNSRVLARAAAGFALSAGAAAAVAQGLPSVPGLTELQQPVATTLQSVCIELNGLRRSGIAPPNPNGTPSERLSNTCSKMVVSSFGNQGQTVPDEFNLKISNQQIATGVQAIAPVQANAQKQMSSEAAKMNTIGSRLLGVRGGARGVVLGVLGQQTQVAGAPPETGGAAGPDDAFGGPWGGFNVAYAWGNVDQTSPQDSCQVRRVERPRGADTASATRLLGGAFSYSDTRSDYDNSLGDVKAQTIGVVGYGTWYKDDWFVDGFVAYGSVGYDTTRVIFIPSNNPSVAPINATATASPDGDQWSAAIGVGKNIPSGTFTITPTARLGYIWVKNKAFSESEPVEGLALAVDDRTVKSLQSALGVRFSTVVSTASGVFGPYFNAQWMHEFENDSPSIVSKYVADPTNQFFAIPTAGPTRDYAILAVGSSATFPNNLTGFAQFTAAVGLDNETNYGVVVGLRKQF